MKSACNFNNLSKNTDKYKQKAVILIDEYDKPILDNITNIEFSKEKRNVTAYEWEKV
jgi:hypothetical protein